MHNSRVPTYPLFPFFPFSFFGEAVFLACWLFIRAKDGLRQELVDDLRLVSTVSIGLDPKL